MLRLHTLGRFELVGCATNGHPPVVVQPKRLALLAYLAIASPRGFHRRDTLLGLLWPNLGAQDARRALRQALHYLRRQLGEEAIVTLSDDRVGLDGNMIDCDVLAMEDAAAAGRHEDALDLCRGVFLDGVFVPEVTVDFDDWVATIRRRVATTAAAAAWRCAESYEARGDGAAAIAAARRAHDLTPNDERGLRQLLQLMRRFSDRAGALDVYREFERRLHDELGGCPSMQTIRIIEEVRTPGSDCDCRRLPTHGNGGSAAVPLHREVALGAAVGGSI